jgi:DNA-binding beta-propeller fold protein YncE
MRGVRFNKFSIGAFVAASSWVLSAQALIADVTPPGPSLVGENVTFRVAVSDAVGAVSYRWNITQWVATDETGVAVEVETEEASYTFAAPGHYTVNVLVVDESGSNAGGSFTHLAHHPVTARPPAVSTPIVYDAARNRVYSVNQDNDSITSIDAEALVGLAELPVYGRPEALAIAPDGKLWVVHRDDYAVSVIDLDTFGIERGFRLPYASQPVALAMSPTGDAAYVTLMALGKLLKLDPLTGDVLGEVSVGPWPRGLSVSHDGKDVFVTRFISGDAAGEVVRVDGPALSVVGRIELVPDTTSLDAAMMGRGLPNYLFSVGITPDGRSAWVTGKKDNVFRGTLRDGNPLNQDSTVRPIAAILDLEAGAEVLGRRIDMDDRSLPAHVTFSPLGDYALVTLAGSNMIEVRDTETGVTQVTLMGSGNAPRGTVFGPDQRLFVQGWLSRSVLAYDMSKLVLEFATETPEKLAEIPTVSTEKLAPEILRGKKTFHSAADVRMTSQGYITCASCHFEGFEDGRVFDFTGGGEGLRNTTSLLGRRGMGQGRVHWSANFDEIQDFEKPIRELFGGRGFIADALLDEGTRREPLGDPLAGLSPELDDLTAYVTSLVEVHPSPFRNPDGTLTADAQAGKELFGRLECGSCHAGVDFTDSSQARLHDVGTMKASSGTRLGEPLTGLDTPTLLGIWETAPYLHDGSAPTLRDVLTVNNPADLHGLVSSLTSAEIDQLVSYLLQLDGDIPPRRLPFETDMPDGDGGVDAGVPEGGAPDTGSPDGGLPEPAQARRPSEGCGCDVARSGSGGLFAIVAWLALAFSRRASKRR